MPDACRMLALADGFRRHGIAAGDRIVVQLPNVPEFVIACFALFRIDAKPVFSLLAHRITEIRHLLDISGAVGYVMPGNYQGFNYSALAATIVTESTALRRVFVLHGNGAAELPGRPALRGYHRVAEAHPADP